MEQTELKKRIDDKGIKYSFIAENIGVSKTIITYWLQGKSKIPTIRFNQIDKLLKSYER